MIAVSMDATRTAVAHVFAAETLSVAAVVSDPVVWVHHVWSAHRDRLLRLSSACHTQLFLCIRQLIRQCLKISHLSQTPVIVLHLSRLLTMRF